MIPAVSSGATWALSVRNFLWTCKTQVRSTFATAPCVNFIDFLTMKQNSLNFEPPYILKKKDYNTGVQLVFII